MPGSPRGPPFFTTSTDGGQTFRYHQVLQTHLEIVLADELGAAGARRPVIRRWPASIVQAAPCL